MNETRIEAEKIKEVKRIEAERIKEAEAKAKLEAEEEAERIKEAEEESKEKTIFEKDFPNIEIPSDMKFNEFYINESIKTAKIMNPDLTDDSYSITQIQTIVDQKENERNMDVYNGIKGGIKGKFNNFPENPNFLFQPKYKDK
jgi:hypothetical protein